MSRADLQSGYAQLTVNSFYILSALLLMPINWYLELLKWKVIVQTIQNSNWKTLIQSLLSGISTGMVTPNRIGNFIGRIIYYPPRNRALLILGTLYANLAQFLASILPGLIVLAIVETSVLGDYFSIFQNTFYTLLLILFFTVLFLLYFALPRLMVKFSSFLRIPYTNLIVLFTTNFANKGAKLFLLSQIRYIIFCLQYFLLFIAFGADPSYELFTVVILIYFLTTATPSLFLGKLFIRENYALLLAMPLLYNELLILVASLAIWFINIAIPSMIGLTFFLKAKYDN
jgi:hypothetical protein